MTDPAREAIEISFGVSFPLRLSQRGDVLSYPENYVKILQCDGYLKGKLRHNAMDGRAELSGVYWNIQSHPIRDEDLFRIRTHISRVYGIRNKDEVKQAIEIVSRENSYHPVADFLNGLTWDGVSRIPELFPRYLGAERSDFTTEITLVLLHGAIQRVFNPGIKFDYVVILADTKQGTGKSSMCRFLSLNDRWYSDEIGNLSDDKATFEAIRGHFVIELGEMLATRKTKDVEAIKAFVSRTEDIYREPYGTYAEHYPRQCIFIGTSNKPQFLPEDPTGNRRFLPLLCDGSKAEAHPLDDEEETRNYIRQCYAEAIEIGMASGWKLVLDKRFDDELEAIREGSTPDDPRIGIIQNWLDTKSGPVCSKMIWNDALHHGDALPPDPQKYELQDIADIMNLKIYGWRRYQGKSGTVKNAKFRFKDYGAQRAWERDPDFVPSVVPSTVPSDPENVPSAPSDGFITAQNDGEVPFGW